jgi:outer membrane biosynthesis protein TonB
MGKIGRLAWSLLLVSACATQPSHTPTPAWPASADSTSRPPRPNNTFPSSERYYRREWQDNGEVGVVGIRACIGPDGRLTEEPTIASSSGYEHVDGAAIALAKAGSGHYEPAIQNGVAVAQCFLFRVKLGVHR